MLLLCVDQTLLPCIAVTFKPIHVHYYPMVPCGQDEVQVDGAYRERCTTSIALYCQQMILFSWYYFSLIFLVCTA